jgi:hypothetical protein
MSINHSAGCADANECFFTPRAEATGTLGYRLLIFFVLSIISWALVVAIVVALLEAICALLWVIASKNELCDALDRLLGFFAHGKSSAVASGAL